MTRGKYGPAAQTRRLIDDQQTSIETYQRRVAALTAEVKSLQTKLDEQHRQHSELVRRLKAEIRECASPSLRIAEREAREQRERADAAKQVLAERQRHWLRYLDRLQAHFETPPHSLLPVEAVEAMVELTSGTSMRIDIDQMRKHGVPPELIERLQQARGQRR